MFINNNLYKDFQTEYEYVKQFINYLKITNINFIYVTAFTSKQKYLQDL